MTGLNDPSPSRPGRWCIGWLRGPHAASKASEVRATTGVGDRMAEVIAFVTNKGQARTAEVALGLGIDANQASVYLSRAADGGRLQRLKRGLYGPVGSVGVFGTEDDPA